MSVVLEDIISIAVHVTLCVTSSVASHVEVKGAHGGLLDVSHQLPQDDKLEEGQSSLRAHRPL